jgi:uncharacterized protein
MFFAWSGTIAILKNKIHKGIFLNEIKTGFSTAFKIPTDSEITSWQNSIPALMDVMTNPVFDPLQIIIELQMPIGAERADIVLLGGSEKEPHALIIELKQWAGIKLDPISYEVLVPGLGVHQHPSMQALNYAGKLHFFSAHAHNYNIKPVVFAHNATRQDKEEITRGTAKEWVKSSPFFIQSDSKDFANHIQGQLLPVDLPDDEHELFGNSKYEQSQHLFSFLLSHATDIARNAEIAIANSGMGLTTQQDRLKNEIISALQTDQKMDFIIQGNPGSGKTLLAVSLLLKAAEQKKSVILALRNNRLQAILRQVFDNSYPGASGLMMFFEPRQGKGIAQFDGHVDLLICDEAQRMESRIMPNVLPKANVCAIFLDETQRLNPPEQGTRESFSNASSTVGRKPFIRTLDASVRCLGGESYAKWVEGLLANPNDVQNLKLATQPWPQNYLLDVCSSIEDLIQRLSRLQTPGERVAMIASFTESPGDINKVDAPDNIRIGYPLTSGFDLYKNFKSNIPWLMSTAHYKQFWMNGRSNQLDRVASIYGTQGFESDFVGVIWGRDFIYRDGNWKLGDPNISYDNIDRLVTGRFGNHHWALQALDLMVNHYRIFLTRGIKGTLIYCEDSETLSHLMSLI